MVGRNAAKLELPPGMKVHPIFNVALLKRYHSQCLIPNPILVDDNAEYEVEQILKHRGRSPTLLVFTKMEGVRPRGRYVGPRGGPRACT